MDSPTVTALILAGGRSSRMRQDKALMLWQGTPLLQRVCQAVGSNCQPVYLLTPWPERYADIVPEGVQFLAEQAPQQGPLVALLQGLVQVDTDWTLLVACDLPNLDATILQRWIEQLAQVPPDILAMVPRQGDRWQPLCGFYRQQACPALQDFVQQGGRSFQTWLSQAPVRSLPVDAATEAMLWNCNTPEDFPSAQFSNPHQLSDRP